jgi:2-haloacid dehalogenase
MPITALIFDFGNVLATWNPHKLYQRFFPDNPQAIDLFLKEIDFHHWNMLQDRGRSFAEGVADLSQKFPQHAHLIRAYDEEWDKAIAGEISGTVALVERLKRAGYPLYILTNFSAEKFPRMRKRFDFVQLFDECIVSGEIGLVKPDPAIYDYLLTKVKRPASDCLFIDDAAANIIQADKMGFVTHHFTAPDQLERHLQQLDVL